jgi:hypothetical protein
MNCVLLPCSAYLARPRLARNRLACMHMSQSPDARSLQPEFPFPVPKGYGWLLARGLVGFATWGPLQPWHYLERSHARWVSETWPLGPHLRPLFAFAKRQDNDDYACFEVVGNRVTAVVLIHGWTSSGYDVLATYATFWDWLKAILDDVAKWAEVED